MHSALNNIREGAANWLCRHRRGLPWRWVGQMSYLIWRAYENRNFDMRSNGEEWCLSRLGSLADKVKCVFDVGANNGEWLLTSLRYSPQATIHAFEIAPPTFEKLQKKTSGLANVILNPIGLADRNEEIDIFYWNEHDGLTSAMKDNLSQDFRMAGDKPTEPKTIRATVIRGDDYIKQNSIEKIDIVKIDVEGMEGSVLRGLSAAFSQRRIRLVQFEYNTTNIVSKFLLHDAYAFFRGFGYRVGKSYPNYVDFRDYNYRHEDFSGPNMIAIRNDDNELFKLLTQNS